MGVRFVAVLFLWCAAVLLAPVRAATPSTLELGRGVSELDLWHRVETLVDESAQLRPQDLQDSFFRPGPPRFGRTSAAVWIRVRVANLSGTPAWWLDLGNRTLHEVDVYVLSGERVHHVAASAITPFSRRPLPTGSLVVPVELPASQEATLLVRARYAGWMTVSLAPRLWLPEAFQRHQRAEQLHWVMYVGMATALGLFNLILFVIVRDRNYLLYVVSLVTIVWAISSGYGGYGSAYELLWPDSPRFEEFSWLASLVAAVYAPAVFIMNLVELRRFHPWLYLASHVMLATIAASSLLRIGARTWDWPLPAASLQQLSVLANLFYLGFLLSLASVLVRLARQGQRQATFTLIAWIPVMATVIYNSLQILRGAPSPLPWLQWASAWELVWMALVLGDRFNREREKVHQLSNLKRFFSPAVATLILEGRVNPMESHRSHITVAFLDLRGFTAFTDKHSPEEVMSVLRRYHAAMGELITRFEGTVEHFAGDGIMIFFNDPVPVANPAERAVRMALAMQEAFASRVAGPAGDGLGLKLGIGIAQGDATLGAIGFAGRMDYGAVGTVCNLAARLCGDAKGDEILVDRRVADEVSGSISTIPAGMRRLKGFEEPVEAFVVFQEEVHGRMPAAFTPVSA